MVAKLQNAETPPGRGKGLKPRLIAMARRLLEHDGLEALTLRAAAREAHVSHMAPYRHFKDKDELLAAVAEEGFRELAAYMDTMAASGDPRGSGVAYVNFALDNPALYRLMFGAGLPSPARFSRSFRGRQRSLPARPANKRNRRAGRQQQGDATAAIARWSIVHGLASLAIDGRVTLPPKGRIAMRGSPRSCNCPAEATSPIHHFPWCGCGCHATICNGASIKSNRSLDFTQAHLVHALQKRQHDGLRRVPGLSVGQNLVPGIGLEYAGAEIAAGAVPAA